MDTKEQIEKFGEFIETSYINKLHELANIGISHIVIDFNDVAIFDHELAEEILDNPDDLIKTAELSIEDLDLPEKKFKVRINNLPKSQNIKIRNIRSVHLNKFYSFEGIVRRASDVRPQVTSARFECPSCGNVISIIQVDTIKEPYRCTCGRKGRFRMLDKVLVDAQHLVIEEAPEDLQGGEQPKRISVFLKEDLVEPKMEKRTTPGSKVRIIGIVREVVQHLKTGVVSTRYDLSVDANYIEPIEQTFEELELTKEEEETILELSKRPDLYEAFTSSIAPSIYGHEDIKEALVLQLMGGVRKEKSDGTVTRGDFHMLLVGDPGCISGDSKVALFFKGMEEIQNLGDYHGQQISEAVTEIRKNSSEKPYDYATAFQKYPLQPVLKVITETGKEVICTYNQPFLTKMGWKRADEILLGTKIRVMPKIPNYIKKLAATNFAILEKKTCPLKEVVMPKYFTPELASLCGYIIGDGHVHKSGYRIICYVNDEETDLLPKLSDFCIKTFGIKPNILASYPNEQIKTIDEGNGLLGQFVSTQTMNLMQIDSRQVAQSLSFLSNKRIPIQIFKSPKNVVASFISWLFEADGCAFGNGHGRTAVQLKSRTPELLRDVQLLLLYFGIHSRIILDNLCIRRSRDIELFAEHIGFNSEKKINALKNVIENIKNKSETQKGKRYQKYERVTKILPAGVRNVYDFEVPKSHSFIANGIVCHNSAKSTLLTFMTKASPKSRYLSGKGSSAAGMTAAIVKDEFLKGWALEAGALVLANGGFCLSGDTKIILANNKIIPIKEILKNANNKEKVFVRGMDEDTFEIKNFLVKHVSVRKSKKLYRLKFDSGDELKITGEHPLLKWDNGIFWENVDRLKVGNCIVSRRSFPDKELLIPIKEYFQKTYTDIPKHLSEELMEFAGLILTDGSVRKKKNGICFYTKDEELEKRYRYLTKELFNKTVSVYLDKRNGVKNLFFSSMGVCSFLEDLGVKRGNKKNVNLDDILSMPNNLIKSFLVGALNGDGSISNRKYGGIITLACASKETADSYRYLFRKVGVIGKVSETVKKVKVNTGFLRKGTYTYYTVNITGISNISKFNDSRLILRKFNSLQKIISRKDTSLRIHLVKEIFNKIRALIPHYEKHILYNNSLRVSRLSHLGVSKNTLTKVLIGLSNINPVNNSKEFKLLRDIVLNDALIIKLIEKEEIENEDVYNLEVDGSHNFFANFILVHNCYLDEMDKMSEEETSALHQALEQQVISISKANIQATLKAQTTVLAAANPKLGRFDPYKSIAEQINLPPALINRFDLIFPVKDIPDKDIDEKIARHVLGFQQNVKMKEAEISTTLIKKYVSYAKQKIFPKLSDGAVEEIKNFYVNLRNTGSGGKDSTRPIPISARQLEALVRLSEASARVRLSDRVTRQDAKRAIRVLRYCLMQVGIDPETGQIDIDRISTGISSSQRSRIGMVKDLINELSEKKGKSVAIEDIIAFAAEKGINESQVEEIIEKLKREAEIFEPKRGFVSKL